MAKSSHYRSPQFYARLCGALYLYIIVAGVFAELFVRSRLVVSGDAVATANNILAHEFLFRVGFSGELLHLAFDIIVAALLYALLKPVDPMWSLVAAFMRVACAILLAAASITHFVALRLLSAPGYLEAIEPAQRRALALLALGLHGEGYAISLVFFGFACLSLGYLVFRSTFLPRVIGVLLAVAGVCYLVSSFAHFLAPAVGAKLFPVLFAPVFVAELSLTLWLLVKGVDASRWETARLAVSTR
jgi:hypothetical protein